MGMEMEMILQYIPLCAVLLCDMLYILEDRLKNRKWIFSITAAALHIFVFIYFLLTESSMEIILLFLMASFAAAVTVGNPKPEKINKD
jgi:hypothetical protein